MIIPTDIVAALLAVLLTAIIAGQKAQTKKIERLERKVLAILVMLSDRGIKVPTSSETERFIKSFDGF